jgi:hypothetical protein
MTLRTARTAAVLRSPSSSVFPRRPKPAVRALASCRLAASHPLVVAALSVRRACARDLTEFPCHLVVRSMCPISPIDAAEFSRLSRVRIWSGLSCLRACVQSAQPTRPVYYRKDSSNSSLSLFDNDPVRAHNHVAGGSRQCVNPLIVSARSDESITLERCIPSG